MAIRKPLRKDCKRVEMTHVAVPLDQSARSEAAEVFGRGQDEYSDQLLSKVGTETTQITRLLAKRPLLTDFSRRTPRARKHTSPEKAAA
ncbi:MAG TPA: hypothetical protein VFN26_11120 [Candidatus Acidoferrum sp.]|nr:hypothetical protein [Candidatus Acidoferrum sp.]